MISHVSRVEFAPRGSPSCPRVYPQHGTSTSSCPSCGSLAHCRKPECRYQRSKTNVCWMKGATGASTAAPRQARCVFDNRQIMPHVYKNSRKPRRPGMVKHAGHVPSAPAPLLFQAGSASVHGPTCRRLPALDRPRSSSPMRSDTSHNHVMRQRTGSVHCRRRNDSAHMYYSSLPSPQRRIGYAGDSSSTAGSSSTTASSCSSSSSIASSNDIGNSNASSNCFSTTDIQNLQPRVYTGAALEYVCAMRATFWWRRGALQRICHALSHRTKYTFLQLRVYGALLRPKST